MVVGCQAELYLKVVLKIVPRMVLKMVPRMVPRMVVDCGLIVFGVSCECTMRVL